jgi:UDPglucose 6-dehydrogenase
MDAARRLLPQALEFASSALDVAADADALVLLTEWNEYRNITPEKLRAAMRGDLLFDLRNVYDPAAMREAGFTYHSIGRP